MAYTSDSPSERLAAVRQAISDTLTAQSYSVAGRAKAMASLQTLREMERELMEEVSNSGSMCSLGIQVEASE